MARRSSLRLSPLLSACALLAACQATGSPGPAWESGTRLMAHVWESSDGAKVPVGTFHDLERGIDCQPGCDETGEVRCVPVNVQPAPDFSDPQCTQPVGGYAGDSAKPDYLTVSSGSTASCALPTTTGQPFAPVTYYEVGSTIDCSQLYAVAPNGSCQPDRYASGSVCVKAGAKVADSDFAAFTYK